LYVGQARALGAMGVLPKQLRPVDVSKVLYELHLVPNRRDIEEPVLLPVEFEGGFEESSASSKSAAAAPIDRRFIVSSLDSFAVRIVRELRQDMGMRGMDPIAPPPRPPRIAWEWPAAAAAAALIAAVCAANWFVARNELTGMRSSIAGLTSTNAELQRSQQDLSATVKDLTAALAVSNTNAPSAAAPDAGASAVTLKVEPVPYGEIPFDHNRLDVLRDLLTTLESQGFHGVLKITNLSGIYCLSGNGSDGYALAAAALPVSRCDLIGNPFQESLSGEQRQSLAFANLIADVRQRTSGAITVKLESEGTGARTSTPYPTRSESLTAGDWNRAAAANNRVEFSAEGNGP
jgi:hypothetical protein